MKTPILILKSLLLSLVFAASAWATEKVNINTASAADLDRVLANVGPSKAEAIVEYRRVHGPFRNADELAQVKGIGLKTVDKNRDLIEALEGELARHRRVRWHWVKGHTTDAQTALNDRADELAVAAAAQASR